MHSGRSWVKFHVQKLGIGIEKDRYIDTPRVLYMYRGCLRQQTTGLGIFYHVKTFTITPHPSH